MPTLIVYNIQTELGYIYNKTTRQYKDLNLIKVYLPMYNDVYMYSTYSIHGIIHAYYYIIIS